MYGNSSSSCSYQGVGPLVEPFRSLTSEVSSMVFLGSFCLFGRSFLSVWVICYVAIDLHVVSIFFCSPAFCLKLRLYLITLQSLYSFYDQSKCIQLLFSYISSLLLLFLVIKVKQSRYTPWRRLGGEGYSSYSFSTSALDGGEWSASSPGRALPPGKGPPAPIL
jgi:hypothetical protein